MKKRVTLIVIIYLNKNMIKFLKMVGNLLMINIQPKKNSHLLKKNRINAMNKRINIDTINPHNIMIQKIIEIREDIRKNKEDRINTKNLCKNKENVGEYIIM